MNIDHPINTPSMMCLLPYDAQCLELEKERTKTLGKASIGGPWTLVNQDGVTQSDTDYRGS